MKHCVFADLIAGNVFILVVFFSSSKSEGEEATPLAKLLSSN